MLDIESLALALTRGLRLAGCLLAVLMLTWIAPGGTAAAGPQTPQDASAPVPPDPRTNPFLYSPQPGAPAVPFPRAETLVYEATVAVGFLSGTVGTVTQVCTVAEPPPPLLVTGTAPAQGEVASMQLAARGSYLGYDLDSTLETRVQPRDWPRVIYTQNSKGSDGRRREVLIGHIDGAPKSSYRGDTTKGAAKGERIWREAHIRDIPEGALDMLSGVLLVRTMIREGKSTLTFPLVDKDRLWQLTLRRGGEKRMETAGAGTFDVVEVVLEPHPFPGEDFGGSVKKFEGVFGIKGKIHLWAEKTSGVVVRIQGDIPVDVKITTMTIGIDVLLKDFSGTPPEFHPVAEKNDGK